MRFKIGDRVRVVNASYVGFDGKEGEVVQIETVATRFPIVVKLDNNEGVYPFKDSELSAAWK